MVEKLNEPISVIAIFNHKGQRVVPKRICWRGKYYTIEKLGLRHTYRKGRTLHHVFSVSSNDLFFRLILNTENLLWKIEEISNGLP